MQEATQRRSGTTRRRAVAGGTLACALLLILALGRVYPPSLTGDYSCPQTSTNGAVRLTIRPLGHGYLKITGIPEQEVTWYADGDRLNISPEAPELVGAVLSNFFLSHLILRREFEDRSLTLPLSEQESKTLHLQHSNT